MAEKDDAPKSKGKLEAFKSIRVEQDIRDPRAAAQQAALYGFEVTPNVAAFVKGQNAPVAGQSLAEMLPRSLPKHAAELDEPDLRPPAFLSPFQGMKDIYLRLKGRASPKTRELLDSAELEDLVKMITSLQENETLVRANEARVKGSIWTKLKDDPGPLLLGLGDPRLCEPWRMFLEGWDLWVPDGGEGVEIFWEGEGEDAAGEAIELLQTLRFKSGELILETRFGKDEDQLTFDGDSFFRLKHR